MGDKGTGQATRKNYRINQKGIYVYDGTEPLTNWQWLGLICRCEKTIEWLGVTIPEKTLVEVIGSQGGLEIKTYAGEVCRRVDSSKLSVYRRKRLACFEPKNKVPYAGFILKQGGGIK